MAAETDRASDVVSGGGARVFLTAEWRHLAILNYEVDPALLASRVPRGTELDTHDGRVYVSVVGFLFLGSRLRGVRVPFHQRFEEVNLRFYVRRGADGGARRGVAFVKELVPRRAVAWLARRTYHENYAAVPMRHRIDVDFDSPRKDLTVEYAFRAGKRWGHLRVRATGVPALPRPGSLDAFIVEHDWGYSAQPDGGALQYQVEHPPWRVWPVVETSLECDAAALYGAELGARLYGMPASAILAEGSPVVVREARRIG